MEEIRIDAYVEEIRANRAGDRSDKARISASYEAASILASITFEVSMEHAKDFFVGQKITIAIWR